MTARLAPAALLLLLLGACGASTAPGSSSAATTTASTGASPTATESPTGFKSPTSGGEVFGMFTVLEKGDNGPMACSAVATSLPPQCSGPKIVGWDWAKAPGKNEEASGVRWNDGVALIGRWDGKVLTLTRPPMSDEAFRAEFGLPLDEPSFGTPCPEPAGGWAVLDPARTNGATMEETINAAQNLPTFGGLWVDQSVNPAANKPNAEGDAMNNPKKLILNVRVTRDKAAAEATLRRTWGGMLCVSEGGRSEADLLTMCDEIHRDHPEVTGSGVDSKLGRVEITTFYDDGSLQRELEEKYGAGLVVVQSTLMAYPPG